MTVGPWPNEPKILLKPSAQQPPATRSKRENDLAVVVEYLGAIQKTGAPMDSKTVEWRK